MFSPCSLTNSPNAAPDCATRLRLADSLAQFEAEATRGVVDTGRFRCAYAIWGQGPTLLLVPGTGMNKLAFVMLMTRLRSQFRCVSFDYPDGIADGARLTTYRHADHVADLFALMDHMAIGECFVLGASLGASIALAAIHEQPYRFSRVILQGAFAFRPLAPGEVLLASFARFLPGRIGNVPWARRIIERQQPTFAERDPDVWGFFVEQNLQIPLRALAERVLTIHRLDLRPILPSIHKSVLLVCGDRDPLVSKACEQELKQGLPVVARGEIENCGHFPQLTHPEVFAEIVRQFLLPAGC